MLPTTQIGYAEESETYGSEAFAETPFANPGTYPTQSPARESNPGAVFEGNWEFTTPFLPGELNESGELESASAEVSAFSEIVGELKDALFREALEITCPLRAGDQTFGFSQQPAEKLFRRGRDGDFAGQDLIGDTFNFAISQGFGFVVFKTLEKTIEHCSRLRSQGSKVLVEGPLGCKVPGFAIAIFTCKSIRMGLHGFVGKLSTRRRKVLVLPSVQLAAIFGSLTAARMWRRTSHRTHMPRS